MNVLNNRLHIIWVFIGYLALSLVIQRGFIKEFPHHIHAWAHCDHYALSKGFIENDFDFFHPQTSVYNKQFVNSDGSEKENTTTAVDFPINNYIVALLMKIFNSDAPVIFRLYTLIVACFGLIYLFKISFHFTEKLLPSLLIPVLAVFTPVFLDYQVGFLPSIAALSLFFAAVYHFIKYKTESKFNNFIYCALLLSLASLIRTPFLIHLIALAGYTTIDSIRKREINAKEWILGTMAFTTPIVYFIYNGHLRDNYGSIFLSSPLIIESLENGLSILTKAKENWQDHYFNLVQYTIISILIFMQFVRYILGVKKFEKQNTNILLWMVISLLGVLLYSILMIPQFENHDYYIIDTFYPLIFIFMVIQLSSLNYSSSLKFILIPALFGLSIFSTAGNIEKLQERRLLDKNDLYLNQYLSYSTSQSLLEKNNISKSERITIIDAYAPNMSFVLSGYSGYGLISRAKNDILQAINWEGKYAIIQKRSLAKEILPNFPDFINHYNIVDQNEKLLLLEEHKSVKPQTLFEFFKLENQTPQLSFTKGNQILVNSSEITNQDFINTAFEFEATFNHQFNTDDTFTLAVFSFSAKDFASTNEVLFTIVHEANNENISYTSYPLLLDNENKFNFRFIYFIPNLETNSTLSSYFYNPSKVNFKFKEMMVEFY